MLVWGRVDYDFYRLKTKLFLVPPVDDLSFRDEVVLLL